MKIASISHPLRIAAVLNFEKPKQKSAYKSIGTLPLLTK
jgi:hypothetical protein